MFGYIVPQKSELRVRDYNLYKSAYCTLCHRLRFCFGSLSRLTVNYDFVFLAMIGMSVAGCGEQLRRGRCNTNPFYKLTLLIDTDTVDYAAACLVMTACRKLSDNIADERFIKKSASFFAGRALSPALKKARRSLPDVDASLTLTASRQTTLEKDGCDSLDLAGDPSACALSHMFQNLSENPDQKRILSRLGYLVGRFVYLADAADDLADDLKTGRYNPLAAKHHLRSAGDADDFCFDGIKESLFLTRSEIASTYNLLNIGAFKEILDNIIFLGLPRTIDSIGKQTKRGHFFDDRPV